MFQFQIDWKKILKIAKIFVKIVTIAFYSNVYTLLCNKNTIYWNKNTTLNKINILWHSMLLYWKFSQLFTNDTAWSLGEGEREKRDRSSVHEWHMPKVVLKNQPIIFLYWRLVQVECTGWREGGGVFKVKKTL